MPDHGAYSIRKARASDAPLLPAIERSAGELFRDDPNLAWVADGDVQDVDQHQEMIAMGTAWVAVDGNDMPVAFLNGEPIGNCLHIWEISVHRDHQRNGLGSMLIDEARHCAAKRGLMALTLTTFRNVAWNQSYYARLGFETLERDGLSGPLGRILDKEARLGFPEESRCAMVMHLQRRAA
jgi:ribosomal protein S18 acetylase RimI-like enzyme